MQTTEKISKAEQKRRDVEESVKQLREWINVGDTVFTNLKQVSRSGMSRHISVHIASPDIGIMDITWHVARVLDYRRSESDGGLVVGGCGMDMGFHVVYSLSRALFRDAFFCTGDSSYRTGCPANDHVNRDKDYSRHLHSDAGYALRQRWL